MPESMVGIIAESVPCRAPLPWVLLAVVGWGIWRAIRKYASVVAGSGIQDRDDAGGCD